MTQHIAILGYGAASSPNDDKLLTTAIQVGSNAYGFDSWGSLEDGYAHRISEFRTGEQRLTPDGSKVFVKEVWLRTWCPGGEGAPSVILQVRPSDQSIWYDSGDQNGTISVTTTACTQTGTAWSTVMGIADSATTVFTTPTSAGKCRIYVNDVLSTDYDITGDAEVTFTSAPDNGFIRSYWAGEPVIRASVGDFIETSEGFHRIYRLPQWNHAYLSWYPSTTLAGTHRPAKIPASGDAETIFTINRTLNTCQFRVIVIPRDVTGAASSFKVTGLNVMYVPGSIRHLRTQA